MVEKQQVSTNSVWECDDEEGHVQIDASVFLQDCSSGPAATRLPTI